MRQPPTGAYRSDATRLSRRMIWLAGVALGPLLALPAPADAQADSLPSGVVFSIRRTFLESLLTNESDTAHSVGARYTAHLAMGEHSAVHAIGADCELHAAGKPPAVIAQPAGLVVEPPNVCKLRLPEISQSGSIGAAWTSFFDDHVTDESCDVTGFPRIFTEHAVASGGNGSNPDHVVEIHPVTSMTCGDVTLDFIPNIKYLAGMRQISDASAIACLAERKLSVRLRGSGAAERYEFAEDGAKGSGGRCGNFVVVDAHLDKTYVRQLSNGGDHVALARVWIGDAGPFPLKIYTYNGTAVDQQVAELAANPDETATIELQLHGVLTYDYFTIAQTVQRARNDWLSASELKDWKVIDHPLSLVAFGVVQE